MVTKAKTTLPTYHFMVNAATVPQQVYNGRQKIVTGDFQK